ncbi:DUF4139 domain-containing protein [Chitinophaga caseinilytica]|uniref:DUF4139 domain-containing protein n=1 Tax=Chitinophaga caseinilytica TaxID=2267521 RepID=UPI003C2FEFBF
MIKGITIFGLLTLMALNAGAQQFSPAALKSVTVYGDGAEMVHTARVSVSKGVSKVIITKVAGNIDESSIQVSAPGGVTIMSATFGRDFLPVIEEKPGFRMLKDSLESVKLSLSKIRNVRTAQEGTLALLDKNQSLGGKDATVAELTKLAEYYTAKQIELRNSIYGLVEKETKQMQLLARIEQQLREMNENPEAAGGQIALQLTTPAEVNGMMEIRYVTPNAGWETHYDLKLESIAKPLKLIYKANVHQNTGLDWKNVKLTLNTGNPSSAGTAPELRTWFLYPEMQQVLGGKVAGLSEVVVVGYGNAKNEEADMQFSRKMKLPAPPPSPVSAVPASIVQHQTSASFDIDIPYDIAGNGENHSVVLKEMDMPSGYTYFSVPKLDQDAFLVANVKDFAAYNLLPGEANIMIGNLYAGKTMIDPQATEDTLKVSLGRDRQVVVRRELMAQTSGTKMIGSSVRKTFTYEIRVRNGKQEAIRLQLKDQYPVSTDKNVEVELTEASGAEKNAETGELTWELDLKPGESKTLRLTYTVKHPKGMQYQGL